MAGHHRTVFGSVAILSGSLSKVAAAGLFVIFIGALIVHSRDGWMMNWYGKKNGEGIEVFRHAGFAPSPHHSEGSRCSFC
jgi:uncharacterized membrane protein YphA (DoxX/SURF4 family)